MMVFRRILQPRIVTWIRNYADSSKSVQDQPQVITPSFSKEGDNGTSKTLTGTELSKDHRIFHAIGAAEELLSYIGLVREFAYEAEHGEHDYVDKLKRVQMIVIDLTTAISGSSDCSNRLISQRYTKELEDWINDYSKNLSPLEQYIIPGGGIPSASLHVARSICRRAERSVVPLVRDGQLDKEALVYLNRLSDFLLVASRVAAKTDKRTETIYIPKPNETVQAQ